MIETVELSTALNAVLSIVFLNKAHDKPTPTVWVCQNRKVYDKSLKKLRESSHIEIVQHGLAHVETDNE